MMNVVQVLDSQHCASSQRFKHLRMTTYASRCFALASLLGFWAPSPIGIAQSTRSTATKAWRHGHLPDGKRPQIEAARIAEVADIPEQHMQLLGESLRRFPYTGETVVRYKLVDENTGRESSAVFDVQGYARDYDVLEAQEKAERYRRFGAMSPQLHARLVGSAADTPVSIMLKLATTEPDLEAEPYDSSEAEMAAYAAQQTAAIEQETRRNLEAALLAANLPQARLTDLRIYGPFVFAQATAAAALRLSRATEVTYVGSADDEAVLDSATTEFVVTKLDDALPLTWTDLTHSLGHTGNGVLVAIGERGVPDEELLECLPNLYAMQEPDYTLAGGSSIHNALAAMMVSNNDPDYNGVCSGTTTTGYAPLARLLLANKVNYQDQFIWARDLGAHVFSSSFHYASEELSPDLHARDLFFDYHATRYPYPVLVFSAGNQATSGAYASGKGYNVLGVGNTALDDTPANRCDNQTYANSSWLNPSSSYNDREIPEISAPGSRHQLSLETFGDTSAAAPVVASTAALVLEANTTLRSKPEAVRAILLASASAQGGDGADWSRFADGRDGVGMVNSYYAVRMTETRESGTTPQWRAHDYDRMYASDFSYSVFNKKWYIPNTTAKFRFVFTWNSKTTGESTSELAADLDLRLYDNNNNLVAVSSSWDNNYEFIDFEPTTAAGPYRVEVHAKSVPSDLSTRYGVAWTLYSDC